MTDRSQADYGRAVVHSRSSASGASRHLTVMASGDAPNADRIMTFTVARSSTRSQDVGSTRAGCTSKDKVTSYSGRGEPFANDTPVLLVRHTDQGAGSGRIATRCATRCAFASSKALFDACSSASSSMRPAYSVCERAAIACSSVATACRVAARLDARVYQVENTAAANAATDTTNAAITMAGGYR